MTTTTTPLGSHLPWQRLIGRAVTRPPAALARALRRVGDGFAAAGRAGQLGQDAERTIGRRTGGRI